MQLPPAPFNARTCCRVIASIWIVAWAVACGTTPEPITDPTPISQTTPAEEPSKPEPMPDPVDPAVVKASNIEEFAVDGLKVILKPTPGPVVVAELLIQGGITNIEADKDGIEEMALRVASSGGTTAVPRDAFTSKLNSMGSEIGYESGRDFSLLTMRSIRPYWGATWELFGQVLLSPAFDQKQIDLQRTRLIDEIKGIRDNPDDYVGLLARELHFKGHPYARRMSGTVESVQKLTRDQLMDHYKALMVRERLTLVVVGDLKRSEVETAIKAQLGSLPKGEYSFPGIASVPEQPADVSFQERKELPTNYLIGLFEAPAPTHPDYFPMLVATSLLSDRLFEEVRTKRNLTYAVAAGLSKRRRNYGYLYVTAVDPNTTVKVMTDEIARMSTELLSADSFGDLVSVFLTEYYMRLETAAAQASLLASSEMTGGGWEQTLVFIDNIKKVTPEDVMRVTNTYIKGIHWGYIGNPDKVQKSTLTAR